MLGFLLFISILFSCSKDSDLLAEYVILDTSEDTSSYSEEPKPEFNPDFDTVENYSALLELTPENGLGMNVLGYSSEKDGGGGVFHYDSTKAGINNGGTIIDGWVRQYSGELNVKWFGTKGDGVTDDAAAIQSVLDVGGDIIFDKATYNIGSQLTIDQPCSIDLSGATITSSTIMQLIAVKKNTVLKNGNITTTYTSSSQSLFGIIEAMNVSLDFLTLQDLFIDGDSNSEIDGIKVDCTVNNSIIKDIIAGSMEPLLVPMARPDKGVKPMLVSIECPYLIAHMLAPLPRWQDTSFNSSSGFPSITAARFVTNL